ncbi:MAG TPA: nuclear transport factor 2 family protein [Thermoleophilaceae bacterium]
MAESNVDLARNGFDAALGGDLDALGEVLDPDVKWHGGDPSAPGSCQNRDQVLGFMRQLEVVQAGGVELVDLVGAGDRRDLPPLLAGGR